MIISASRRTDIPAFYHEWFINRIREGFLYTRNPFNAHQIARVSLIPSEVDIIVFWTRNPEKLIPFISEMNQMGYRYYFQFTITGYPRVIEKSVPNPNRAIEIFKEISKILGPGKIVWRYDPILLSNKVDAQEHKRLFSKIAEQLEGHTKRVVISFADFYKKTERNLKAIATLQYSDITKQASELYDLAQNLSLTASNHNMQISSCSEIIDLDYVGIRHGKCIDDQLIFEEFGIRVDARKDKGQREECGCIKSVDIGQYNTCLHGCSYCYATFSPMSVEKNRRMHNPKSPFLVGGSEEENIDIHKEPASVQVSLF